jgi:hypothetical protein
MLNYSQVKNKPKILRTITSLDYKEFEKLKNKFKIAWEEYIYDNHIKGKDRQRKYGAGRKPTLLSIEDKLLFILFYFKIYPLQEVIAFMFGMSQSQANEWIQKLSVILNKALDYQKQLPERSPKNLQEVLTECSGLEFVIDGTERRIQRPKDNNKQTDNYSGKKKLIQRKTT